MTLITRMRRRRQHEKIRDLLRETYLTPNDLVYPLFIKAGLKEKKAIVSMPGQYQLSLNDLQRETDLIANLGIPAIVLFGIPEHKDALGSESYHENGIIQQAIVEIKKHTPELLIITDTCFCEYTDHVHCGVMNDKTGKMDLDNDETLALLAKQALCQAQAGADVIAPSGMIDGMIGAIRTVLDKHHYTHIPILSYAVKYASAVYGPFREAAESTLPFGDRKTYQMDPANAHEAIREAQLDINEGADMLMVKPALPYLDIIYKLKQKFPEMPLSAYQVSGEYAMIKAAANNGWINEKQVVLEQLTSIKRAGTDFIISYYAKEAAKWLSH